MSFLVSLSLGAPAEPLGDPDLQLKCRLMHKVGCQIVAETRKIFCERARSQNRKTSWVLYSDVEAGVFRLFQIFHYRFPIVD